jgi:hypothetical protein
MTRALALMLLLSAAPAFAADARPASPPVVTAGVWSRALALPVRLHSMVEAAIARIDFTPTPSPAPTAAGPSRRSIPQRWRLQRRPAPSRPPTQTAS